jgi:phospholipid/cholesterol/gamma-HCH transport system permease protein
MMEATNNIFGEIGRTLLFLSQMLSNWKKFGLSKHLLLEQVWKVTAQSALTTGLAGFFVGAIMTVQFTLQMAEFGALGYLGGLTTSATIREVGPLLIAFMLAGKVGAFTSAELGTMQVTEQIDAIRCLGADPITEIVLPRFVAIVISSFFLLGLGLVLSVFGGIVLGSLFSGVSAEEYLRHIPTIVTMPSILTGIFKCFVFAVVLAAICTYRGYTASGGAKVVGIAVVKTAVGTMVAIVIADWLTSMISDRLLNWIIGS